MTTTQILEEIRTVRDRQTKKSFKGIKIIKAIYTVAYIICAALLAYVCFDSPIFANENNPLLGGIAVTMAALFFYFVLRFNMSRSKKYGAGGLVWRCIVTAIMTFVFLVMLFVPHNSPDIIITNVSKEIVVGESAIEVSGIALYFIMIGLAVVSHIICVVLWNKGDDLGDVQIECIKKLESLSDKPLTYSECCDIVENLDYCIARSLSNYHKNKSLAELTPDAIWRAEKEEEREREIAIRNRPYTPPTTEEKLLDEVKELNKKLEDIQDRYK